MDENKNIGNEVCSTETNPTTSPDGPGPNAEDLGESSTENTKPSETQQSNVVMFPSAEQASPDSFMEASNADTESSDETVPPFSEEDLNVIVEYLKNKGFDDDQAGEIITGIKNNNDVTVYKRILTESLEPTPGKKYERPVYEWWQNDRGTWNCTMVFNSTDGKESIKILAPLIHYERSGNSMLYQAEADFGDSTFLSTEHRVDIPEPVEGDEQPQGRESSRGPMGIYAAELNSAPQEPPKAIEDEENPLSDMSEANINMLLKQLQEGVRMMESIWNTTRIEFKLTDSIMKEVYKFNSDHAETVPDGLSQEEIDKWDYFNGIDKMTEEDVVKIFGADSNIIGIEHGVTISRIKDAANDLHNWTYALREYTNVHNAYMALIEEQEAQYINQLKEHAAAEEDPEKRKAMEDAIEFYYYRKHLGFLANPEEVDEQVTARVHRAWKDERKIEYWIKRSKEKLKKMKISPKAILEISSFEKRFLPEKYHKIDNVLLTYFLNICTYCKPDDKKDAGRNMVVCMVFALDQLIRNVMPDSVKEEVVKNILIFEDLMYKEILGDEEITMEDPSAPNQGDAVPEEGGIPEAKSEE